MRYILDRVHTPRLSTEPISYQQTDFIYVYSSAIVADLASVLSKNFTTSDDFPDDLDPTRSRVDSCGTSRSRIDVFLRRAVFCWAMSDQTSLRENEGAG
jgi:hypothetical protein